MFYGFCFCNTVYIKKTLLTKDFVYFICFYQPQNMLAIFFSASEYAYNMLRFFRNFSLNMLIVVMLIKKRCRKNEAINMEEIDQTKKVKGKIQKKIVGGKEK